MRRLFAALVLLCLALVPAAGQSGLVRPAAALTEPAASEARRGALFVPAYAELTMTGGAVTASLAVTLAIHNTSPDRVLNVRRIDFHDTAGRLLQAYLDRPIGLKPFASITLFVSIMDRRGGNGANFRIDWAGEGDLSDPLAEAIMTGEHAGKALSFVSRGVPISPAPAR